MSQILTTGGTALAAVKNNQFATFGNPFGVERLLAGGLNIDANSATTDYALQMGSVRDFTGAQGTPRVSTIDLLPYTWSQNQRYRVTRVVYDNPSATLSSATAGLFSAVSAGGVTIVTSATVALTVNAVNAAGSSASPAIAATTALFDLTTLFFRIGTAQVGRLDVYIYGIVNP